MYTHIAACTPCTTFIISTSLSSLRPAIARTVFSWAVCLSVRKHISRTTRPIFTSFCACRLDLVLLWWHCDAWCTSGFMDDIMFAHSGPFVGVQYRCSKWRLWVVVRRLTPLLCCIGCFLVERCQGKACSVPLPCHVGCGTVCVWRVCLCVRA